MAAMANAARAVAKPDAAERIADELMALTRGE
jgi:UDP-N-acetylglucosamine:LPS N-acetylglucosamine transferase